MDVFDELLRLAHLGQKCALATIVQVRFDSRLPGGQAVSGKTAPWWAPSARVCGSRGLDAAREVMETGKPRNMSFKPGQERGLRQRPIAAAQLECSWNASRPSLRADIRWRPYFKKSG